MTANDFTCELSLGHCYQLYGDQLRRFLTKMVRCTHCAEELLHDVFLKVLEKNKDLTPGSRYTVNFLFAVARNRARDYLRRKRNEYKKYSEHRWVMVDVNEDLFKSVEDYYIEGEVLSTIHDTIQSFPQVEQDLYYDRIYTADTKKSCGARYGISPFRVRKIEAKISRTVEERLRPLMNDE
jgi:RNA polymerase sigma factor (sigma-70 family)